MILSALRSPIRSALSSAIRSALSPGFGAPTDYATTWNFYKGDAEFAKTPWAALTSSGLGTRVENDGDVAYGPHNLLLQSESLGGAPWSFFNPSGGATRSGNEFVFGASAVDRVLQTSVTVTAGVQYRSAITVSGSGSIRLYYLDGNGATIATTAINLTPTPTEYTVSATSVTSGSFGGIGIYNNAAGIAGAGFTVHKTALSVGYSAYVPTTTTARYLLRIDHDPVTHSARGLLVEGQTTNLLGQTDDLTGSEWALTNAVTPSISGYYRGRPLWTIANASSGFSVVEQNVGSISTAAICRVYLFAGTATGLNLGIYKIGDAWTGTSVDKVSGPGSAVATGTSIAVTGLSASVPTVLDIKTTTPASAQTAVLILYLPTASGGSVRAQFDNVEAGPFATSYIPNPGTGTAVRAADDWYLSGAALDVALGATRSSFTLFIEWYQPPTSPGFRRIVFLGKDDDSRRLIVNTNGSAAECYVNDGTTAGFTSSLGSPIVAGALNRLAFSCDGSTVRVVLNGSANGTRSSVFGGAASAERLRLLHDAGGVNLNSYVRRARAYPDRAMSIAEMQALTA